MVLSASISAVRMLDQTIDILRVTINQVLQELLWVKRSCIASDFVVLVLSEAVLVLDGFLNRCTADG
ncbi:MAG: hypothetical protein ACK449_08795 [Planctomycetota bacterium]|jgi:hypothetical protein